MPKGVNDAQKQEFYSKYYPLVSKYTQGTGLHPEFVLAQMALESNYGTSQGAQDANVLFGIKTHGKNVPAVSMDTTEVNADGAKEKMKQDFRAYDSPDAAIKDYVSFLQTNPRYANAMTAATPQDQAVAFQEAGYATAKDYATAINNTIESNKPEFSKTVNEYGTPKVLSNLRGTSGKYEAKVQFPDGTIKTFTSPDKKDYSLIGNNLYAIGNAGDKGIKKAQKISKDTQTIDPKQNWLTDVYKGELNDLKKKSDNGYLGEEGMMRYKSLMADAQNKFTGHEKDFKQLEDYALKNVFAPHAIQENEIYMDYRKNKAENIKAQMNNPNLNAGQLASLQKQYDQEMAINKKVIPNYEAQNKKLSSAMAGQDEAQYTVPGGGVMGTSQPYQYKDNVSFDNLKKMQNDYTPLVKQGKAAAGDQVSLKKSTNTAAGGSGSSFSNQPNIMDMSNPTIDDYNKNPQLYPDFVDIDALKKANQRDTELLSTMPKNQEQPTVNEEGGINWSNIAGNAMDVGRGILGLVGATEKVPTYQRGEVFSEYVDDARRYKDMGLTPEEIGFRKQQAERGYGYDVANIRGLSGGSSGVALANLGRAAEGLQTRYGQIGVEDQQVRRNNRQAFAQAALADEQVNRQIFTDKLNQTMMNKEAGAGLVRDSIANMNERQQYNEAYGPKSQYAQYMNELIKEKNANTTALQTGQNMNVNRMKSELQANIDERNAMIKKQAGYKDSVNGDQSEQIEF